MRVDEGGGGGSNSDPTCLNVSVCLSVVRLASSTTPSHGPAAVRQGPTPSRLGWVLIAAEDTGKAGALEGKR